MTSAIVTVTSVKDFVVLPGFIAHITTAGETHKNISHAVRAPPHLLLCLLRLHPCLSLLGRAARRIRACFGVGCTRRTHQCHLVMVIVGCYFERRVGDESNSHAAQPWVDYFVPHPIPRQDQQPAHQAQKSTSLSKRQF